MSDPNARGRAPGAGRPARMNRSQRVALSACGLGSWAAGAVATFQDADGVAVSGLILAGFLASLLGFVGFWPARISLSGSEMVWDEVVGAVEEQISAAVDSGESAAVHELEDLRRRLKEAQRTGSTPAHPAALYDQEVREALQRALPHATILMPHQRTRDFADFRVILEGNSSLSIETKYKMNAESPFMGSTLARLLKNVRGSDRLLIVTNAPDIQNARRTVSECIGDRGMVISWRSHADDDVLRKAVDELLHSDARADAEES